MPRYYSWKHELEIPPYDKVIDVVEAFFCSYPDGEYSCESKSTYKLEFRRGAWKRSITQLGDFVPEKLVKGQFAKWPIVVKVMVRPSPTTFHIAVHYDLYLPKGTDSLAPNVQSSVGQHARRELAALADYLAECVGIDTPPKVKPID